jgi:hypothetical protein
MTFLLTKFANQQLCFNKCNMDLKELIMQEYSKVHANLVAEYILSKPELMSELFDIIYLFEDPLSKRASWSLKILSEKDSSIIDPYVDLMVDMLPKTNDIPILKLVLATLRMTHIPESKQGELLQFTSDVLTDSGSSIASLIYSMDIFYNLSRNEPDLLNELRHMLEMLLPNGSAGVKNKSHKLIKRINKQIGY